MDTVLLTPKELAQALRLSTSTVTRMARAGEIPAERYRDCWRFDLAQVRAARLQAVVPEPVRRRPTRQEEDRLLRRIHPWPQTGGRR